MAPKRPQTAPKPKTFNVPLKAFRDLYLQLVTFLNDLATECVPQENHPRLAYFRQTFDNILLNRFGLQVLAGEEFSENISQVLNRLWVQQSPSSSQEMDDDETDITMIDPPTKKGKRKEKPALTDEELKLMCLNSFLSLPSTSLELPRFQSANHCMEYIKTLQHQNNIQNNEHFFSLGECFIQAKAFCVIEKIAFVPFVEENIKELSLSRINTYIRFVELCQKEPRFIRSSLSLSFISKHQKRISNMNL